MITDEFHGDAWLDMPIELPGGTLQLVVETAMAMQTPMALVRTGRKSNVYKALLGDRVVAIKVFHKPFAVPENLAITNQLRALKALRGMTTCDREVPTVDDDIGLAWSIVMPWIDGLSWSAHIDESRALSDDQSIAIANETAGILAQLEQLGLVHADLCGNNVVIARHGPPARIELIDVEDMYHSSFVDVPHPPDGTAGYVHPANVGLGTRKRFGDRFAGAVLLAEMLAWHDPAIRAASGDDSVFDQSELTIESPKFVAVRDVLQARSDRLAELFEQAWTSPDLKGCPPLSDWSDAVSALAGPRFADRPPHVSRIDGLGDAPAGVHAPRPDVPGVVHRERVVIAPPPSPRVSAKPRSPDRAAHGPGTPPQPIVEPGRMCGECRMLLSPVGGGHVPGCRNSLLHCDADATGSGSAATTGPQPARRPPMRLVPIQAPAEPDAQTASPADEHEASPSPRLPPPVPAKSAPGRHKGITFRPLTGLERLGVPADTD